MSTSEENINSTAHVVVALVRTFPAPEAPNNVLLPPPKLTPTLAPFPCCNSTRPMIAKHKRM
jgi:hypothetical protein